MLVHRNNARSIEKYWDIIANAHVITKSFFLLFGVSAKLYIPSAIITQVISVMTGVIVMSAANNNAGS